MTLIEAGTLLVWLVLPCCVGAAVAALHGDWRVGLLVAGATFVALPPAAMLWAHFVTRRIEARHSKPKE